MYEVVMGPHKMPSVEVKNPTDRERKRIKNIMLSNYINDERYEARSKAGAFLQCDCEDYMLIEFWEPNYEDFVNLLNKTDGPKC